MCEADTGAGGGSGSGSGTSGHSQAESEFEAGSFQHSCCGILNFTAIADADGLHFRCRSNDTESRPV